MSGTMHKLLYLFLSLFFLNACAATAPPIPVESDSVEPGTSVTRGGTTELALLGEPIRVGDPLPSVSLADTHLQNVDLSGRRGEVLLISVVPSIDTGVCERQTHILGEEGRRLSKGITRITISRDLPFAQKRFAEEAKLEDVLFLSDYRKGDFGRATGLLTDEIHLLARSIILIDRAGRIRYIQVVPELSHLPDMKRAFARAEELIGE